MHQEDRQGKEMSYFVLCVSNALGYPVERTSLQEAFWRSLTFYMGNEALCDEDISACLPQTA
jgi:hypothetical protein